MQGTCPSFTTEEDCLNETPLTVDRDPYAVDLGYNYTCRWDGSECVRLTCGDFSDDEASCETFSGEEYNMACDFATVTLGAGTTDVCYNDCPKRYEVVFTIDTTNSIAPRDRNTTEDTIKFAMVFLWELVKLQNHIEGEVEVSENVKFALVTFVGEESVAASERTTTHFDLRNDFTSLADYIVAVTNVFDIPDLYGDGTPTLDGLVASLDIFRDSPFDEDDDSLPPIRRVEALVTDGAPNVPAIEGSPCDNAYGIDFTEEFGNLPVTFYGVFVGGFDIDSFDCLLESPLRANFLEVESFDDLATTFNVFSTEVCDGPYQLPTETPTATPTDSPTPGPTRAPTSYVLIF